MDVLMVTVFVSLLLAAGGVALFLFRMRAGDFDHGDRLSLLPLEEERAVEDPAEDSQSEVVIVNQTKET
jgi:cbb3-type cytochrome oxidase maturation protein